MSEANVREMTAQELEAAAKAEAAKAKEAADEAAQANTKAAAEKAAKKAVEAAEKATELIALMEERKAKEAAEAAEAAKAVDPEKDAAEKERQRAMEMVTVQLFKDEERYKDDVPVFVNGTRVLIKRGVPVQVPRYIAEVVAASQKQDSQTEVMMMRLVEEYEQNTQEKTKPYGG